MSDFDLGRTYDLIIAPSRSFQVLETGQEVEGLFRCVHRHLSTTGTCVSNAARLEHRPAEWHRHREGGGKRYVGRWSFRAAWSHATTSTHVSTSTSKFSLGAPPRARSTPRHRRCAALPHRAPLDTSLLCSTKHRRNARWTTRAVWFSAAPRPRHPAALWSIFAPPFSNGPVCSLEPSSQARHASRGRRGSRLT